VVPIKSGPQGVVEPAAVAGAMNEDVACIMITNPNTLGLFEEHIAEIARIVHAKGGQVYGDGANLNALLGIARPGDMGIDAIHTNLRESRHARNGLVRVTVAFDFNARDNAHLSQCRAVRLEQRMAPWRQSAEWSSEA